MYEEIINDIKANLGENRELNKKYLSSQIDRYKDHPYSTEIIREISRMMWDCLSDEERDEFIRICENENPVLDILNEISEYIEKGDYKTALNILKDFMNHFPEMFEDDKVSEYHSFTNPLEEIIFLEYIGLEKELRYIPDNQPLLDLYYVYGFLLFENQEYGEAEESLKKALKINPVTARVILELSEIYKMHTYTLNKFVIYTTDALKYAYQPQDIARCYRNLGYYYVEEGQMDVAVALYKYSMVFEMSISAYSELHYIESKGQNINITLDEAIAIIESKNIQLGINPFVLNSLKLLAKEYEENKLYAQSLYFYELIYNVSHEEDIFNKINEIDKKLNN